MASLFLVVNRLDQGYGFDIPLNAKDKRDYTFKTLKKWPNDVKQLYPKNIYNPEKGYNLQDKQLSNQSLIHLKVFNCIHKAAQKSLETSLNEMVLKNHS